ncbi:hypothetical protein Patl1_30205 [Pistacia atlantica]|uniref:Uncharacterized protein n=1 Tax=Pistacia atlantica TaxID=434234 RepID=A0ACC1AB10_9ROSI|nr:hypothetical protein Patl1_30205 [Pistacia atlantica]
MALLQKTVHDLTQLFSLMMLLHQEAHPAFSDHRAT